jgi:hypothetical protein
MDNYKLFRKIVEIIMDLKPYKELEHYKASKSFIFNGERKIITFKIIPDKRLKDLNLKNAFGYVEFNNEQIMKNGKDQGGLYEFNDYFACTGLIMEKLGIKVNYSEYREKWEKNKN